jgi:hypothetical protein
MATTLRDLAAFAQHDEPEVVLNTAGAHGFELVAMVQSSASDMSYYFKRPSIKEGNPLRSVIHSSSDQPLSSTTDCGVLYRVPHRHRR